MRKITVYGLGEGGGSIATEVYKVLQKNHAVKLAFCNTATVDLAGMDNHPKLIIGGKGTGKNVQIGRKLADDNSDKIEEFQKKQSADTDINVFIACWGGGSGGSLLDTFIETSDFLNKKNVVITVLPAEDELPPSKPNATLHSSRFFSRWVNTPSGSDVKVHCFLVFDNTTLLTNYMSDTTSYYTRANKYIGNVVNTILSMKGISNKVFGSLDEQEIENVVFGGRGCCKYEKIPFQTLRGITEEDIISGMSSEEGVLITAGDIKSVKRILAVLHYRDEGKLNIDYAKNVFRLLGTLTKDVIAVFSASHNKDMKVPYMLEILGNGMELDSKRINKMANKAKSSLKKIRKQENKKSQKTVQKASEFEFQWD